MLLSGSGAAADPPALPAPSARSAPAAPASEEAALQRLVERIVDKGAPGATLTVRDGSSTRTFTSGVADIETGRELRAEDRYRAGSTTKTFMSTMADVLHGELENGDVRGKVAITI